MVVSARRRRVTAYGRPMGPYIASWNLSIIIAGNTAGMTYLWYQGGNVTAVHDAGELWTSIGRLTGYLSAFSALLQVLLQARLPFIERAMGFDQLTVWHRRNGKICLYLVLAHTVFHHHHRLCPHGSALDSQ